MNDFANTGPPDSPAARARDGGYRPDQGHAATQPGAGARPPGAYTEIPRATTAASGRPGPGNPAPYGQGKRLFYGLLWSGWTLLLGLGGLFALPHGRTFLGGLLALGLAALAGRYAYRIWTWQAKRLIFFIIW